jgi:hypothetical protein
MAAGANEPKSGENGPWWKTVPGVLTGLAALLTAVGSVVVALHQAGLLSPPPVKTPPALQEVLPKPVVPPMPAPASVPAPTNVPDALMQVEGVGIKILAVWRTRVRSATLVNLRYTVTTGSDFSRHDPAHFVTLVSGDNLLTPVWVSAPARDLPPNSRQEILLRFASPPGASSSVVFRFGEESHLEAPSLVLD